MEINKIIPKIRFKLDDTNEVLYSDFQIYEALNEANRFFRKICVDNAPELIARENEGKLQEGDNLLYVGNNPIKITEVRIEGRRIHPAIMSQIEDTKASGTPKCYVAKFIGSNVKLFVYPVPQSETEYSVAFIDEVEEITQDSELLYPNEVVNYFIDFVVTRLSKGDAEAFSELSGSLAGMLTGITPSPCVVESYY